MVLDQIDVTILREVQASAKVTFKELSEKVSLSATPIFERLKKLESAGYIKGYHAELNNHMLGYDLIVMCYVSLRSHEGDLIKKFQQDVVSLGEVLECYHITGVYDYLLKITVKDIEAYQKFLSERLATLGNIGNVQSNIVMNVLKTNAGLPI